MRKPIISLDVVEQATGEPPEMESLDALIEAKGAIGLDSIAPDANRTIDPIEHVARIERYHARPLASMYQCAYLVP